MEDSKQLILEGQHHVILHTIGKEAFSCPQKQVITVFFASSCEPWNFLVGWFFGFLKGSGVCRLLY